MSKSASLTQSFIPCKCSHKHKKNNQFETVCLDCGLVLDEGYFSQHCNQDTHNIGKVLTHTDFLGTKIIILRRDNLRPGTITTFKRLQKLHAHARYTKKTQAFFRVFSIYHEICPVLSIPKYIIKDACFRFRKIYFHYYEKNNGKIANLVVASCVCLWESIKTHRHVTTLEELIKAYEERKHPINQRRFYLFEKDFSRILRRYGVKKSKVKTTLEYIPRIHGALLSHKSSIAQRLRKKGVEKTVEEFIAEICAMMKFIRQKLKLLLERKGFNPLNSAGAILYMADYVLSIKENRKRVFTFRLIEEYTGIKNNSMRDIWREGLRRFIKKKEC